VSAFQRASDPEIIFSASTQRLEAKNEKRKLSRRGIYQGEEAGSSGDGRSALKQSARMRALKRDLAELG